MDEQKVPRRMRRFYRSGEQAPPTTNYSEYNDYSDQSIPPDFGNIPSMNYEDLEKNMSDENKKEIQRLEQGDLEQKLALFEVEKFKKKNKRLPNKVESQQIANNIYDQFKDSNDFSESGKEGRQKRGGRRDRSSIPPSKRKRMQRNASMQDEAAKDAAIMPKGNIKDMFGSAGGVGASISDEFKLDLGADSGTGGNNELNELGDLESNDDFSLGGLDEKSTCPNCKAKTDKIIYCSKCGTAFCKTCGKNGGTTCPKCETIVKK
jgi:hypothetical protein